MKHYKYHFKQLILLCLILMVFSAMAFNVSAAEVETVETVEEEQEQSNFERWMEICRSMGKNLTKHHFRYSKVNTGSSYKQSLRKYRRSNCASYVSWCLQEYGILKKGQMIYAKGRSGIPSKRYASMRKKVKIIRVNKRPSRAHLKPGDVVLWRGIIHINIYAGKNSKGKMVWFDGGSAGTRRGRIRWYNSADKKKEFRYLNGHTVSYIIRIKDL